MQMLDGIQALEIYSDEIFYIFRYSLDAAAFSRDRFLSPSFPPSIFQEKRGKDDSVTGKK